MNKLPPGVPTAPIRVDLTKRPEHIRKSEQALIDTFNWECCPNCDHWDDGTEMCKKFGARPPAKVIVIGCVEYEVGIPF
jgi:hypothetical protein